MKKLISAVLAGALALSLAACGSTAASSAALTVLSAATTASATAREHICRAFGIAELDRSAALEVDVPVPALHL